MYRFNIRVYGILINEQQQVLVSDELVRGQFFTKFPGGGLEYGEGTRDCLKREFMEEMNLKVSVLEHIYTTDFFQESAFRPGDQIISIYYRVQALEPITVRMSSKTFDFDEAQMTTYNQQQEIETFRFIDWKDFSEASMDLPIDKVVAGIVRRET
jgi:ADP-ribose pyrophosphatase YjhB (NUDIX family)